MIDSPVHILIIDDSPEDRETFRRMLTADSELLYQICETELGEEGLQVCLDSNLRLDCVLLDYGLPDMDGLEFLRRVGRSNVEARPAILMLTGQGSEAVAVQAMKAGAQDYLVKGKLRGEEVCIAVRNAIERVRLGRRIEEQRRELEQLAAERARLVDELADANRHKDEFLAMLAHEMRNMLSPLRNGLAVLRTGTLSAADAEWTHDVIDRQVELVTRLVEDLLDVSRIAQGKVELRRRRIGLADVVRDAVEANRAEVERSGRQLIVELPADPLPVDADPTRISQVLVNLLNNAVKYTPKGGCIRVLVERQANEAVVSIHDTGIGIPEEMLARIFELFTQLNQTDDDGTQAGLGIGLTLVQRLVQLHGGVVEARSPGRNQGSEFIVRLPLVEQPPGSGRGSPEQCQEGNPGESSRRILISDDD